MLIFHLAIAVAGLLWKSTGTLFFSGECKLNAATHILLCVKTFLFLLWLTNTDDLLSLLTVNNTMLSDVGAVAGIVFVHGQLLS